LWDQRAELWGRLQQHFHTHDLALQTIRDHAAILKAIVARDADAARVAMHRHISRVAREFQRGVDVKTQPPAAVPVRKPLPRPRPAKARA
jgi:DNA-binding GntR family transcriptional regulator